MKKIYNQPVVEIISMTVSDMITTSPGWARDGNDKIDVDKEKNDYGDEYYDNDSLQDDGFFLDLD